MTPGASAALLPQRAPVESREFGRTDTRSSADGARRAALDAAALHRSDSAEGAQRLVLAAAFGGFCLCFMTTAAPAVGAPSLRTGAAAGVSTSRARPPTRTHSVLPSAARLDRGFSSSPVSNRLSQSQ